MKGDSYGQKCGEGSLGHMQSKCFTEISNPFAKGAGIRGAHQSPGRAGQAPCRGRCPSAVPRWQRHLLTQLGQWWGDAAIWRDRLWHLSVGRRGKRCHLRALWRMVWKARADPANGGETWTSPHVLNLLSTSRRAPACRHRWGESRCAAYVWAWVCFCPTMLHRDSSWQPKFIYQSVAEGWKNGAACAPHWETRALAPAQPAGATRPSWIATTALNHGCYQR